MTKKLLLLIALCSLVSGCHSPDPIPTYPSMDAPQSFTLMEQRSSSVYDISGQGEITLVDPSGNSVRFDAAFALAPPDRAHIRAWKFGQAVLDLTLKPDGVWLFLPRQDAKTDKLRAASSSASGAIRQWLDLLSSRPDAGATSVQTTLNELIVTKPGKNGLTIICTIDRATLTPRRYIMRDSTGRTRFSLELDQYRPVGSTVWPSHVDARAENQRITIDMHDVEINTAPPHAFDPPVRAERLQ